MCDCRSTRKLQNARNSESTNEPWNGSSSDFSFVEHFWSFEDSGILQHFASSIKRGGTFDNCVGNQGIMYLA